MQNTFTSDELARGSKFWKAQYSRGMRMFSNSDWNVRGWDEAQKFMDKVSRCRAISHACRTYGPCSRECVG